MTWFYPGSGAASNNRSVTYNYMESSAERTIWTTSSLARSTWADSAIFGKPHGTAYYSSATDDSTVGNTEYNFGNLDINLFPNPAVDLIAIQIGPLVKQELTIEFIDISGKTIKTPKINAGSSIAYFDVQAIYEGTYFVKVSNKQNTYIRKVIIIRN